jgi:hypothetical protein
MTREDLARLILIEVERRCEAVRSRPRPPDWQWWNVRDYEADLEYGPAYTPQWFGDLTATEAGRVRVLRTLYRLADAGLLMIVKSEGGRLERVYLTPAGSSAAAELQTAGARMPAGA